jgi:hypothetical protein
MVSFPDLCLQNPASVLRLQAKISKISYSLYQFNGVRSVNCEARK